MLGDGFVAALGQSPMRLALFFVINVLAAIGFGFLAASQGYGAWGIAFVVIGVLAVLQLAYVLWLVALSKLGEETDKADTASAKPYIAPTSRTLSRAESVPGKQAQ